MSLGFDDEKHPRDDHGRFSAGKSDLGTWADKRATTKLAGSLFALAERAGGYSYRTGGPTPGGLISSSPSKGFMVSLPTAAGFNHIVDIKEMASRSPEPTRSQLEKEIRGQVEKWIEKTLPTVKDKQDHYLGGWMERHNDGTEKAFHLDVSQRFADKTKAIQAGQQRNQMSIRDLAKKRDISTGGTGR